MGNTLTFERMTEKSVMNLVERIADSNKDAGDQLHRLKKSMLKSLHSLVHSFPNESFSFKELVENERFSLYMGGSLDYPVAQPDPLKDPQPVYRVFIDDGKLWFNQPDEYIIPANKLSVEAICEIQNSLHEFCHTYFEFMQQDEPEGMDIKETVMKTIQTSISVGESIRVAGIDMNVISVDHKYSFAKLQATDKSEMATINISVLEEIKNRMK